MFHAAATDGKNAYLLFAPKAEYKGGKTKCDK